MDSAGRSGVNRFLIPGITMETSSEAKVMADTGKGIFAAAGIHPGHCGEGWTGEIRKIPGILVSPCVIAVGETGMDLYRDRTAKERQRDCFAEHIRMAEAFGLSLVVHSRSAEAEVLEVLGEEPSVPVIMHCYTGPSEHALEAADRGFYIGFTGPLTYRANGRLRELAAALPRDRILIETDSPYLSPEPVRGRRNEPAYLVHVAETLSEVLEQDLDETAQILMRNSMRALQLEDPRRTDLIYELYGNLYLNITGRCSNHCRFCIRDRTDGLGGYYLRHYEEPDPDRLRALVGFLPPGSDRELVFCGYGEPTMRHLLLEELARSAAEKGYRVRLNTNGTCLQRLSRRETLRMLEPFHTVSVSLNASSMEEYERVCRPSGSGAWKSLLEFLDLARGRLGIRATAVRYPGVDMDAVEKLADNLDLPFRVR